MSNNKGHGWYSVKQAQVGGVGVYATPDGREVEITEVTREKKPSGAWDDYAYVGEVCGCQLRTVRRGELADIEDMIGDCYDSGEEIPDELFARMYEQIARMAARDEKSKNDPNRFS